MLSLNLPEISDEQLQKGVKNLKQMNSSDIQRMATALKTMDPRIVEDIFKSQGVMMSADDIMKMSEALTPDNIKLMTKSIEEQKSRDKGEKKEKAEPIQKNSINNPKNSRLLREELGRSKEEIDSVLSLMDRILELFNIFKRFFNIFTVGNRKYITGAFFVGLISIYATSFY
ncbi:unnamed protein product [Blepharisma stoltei]|uniref:Uncharacterized protein n=1 Tax=Blepharisma stoltei TaxID=1481888 RepID=A0AAU9KD78_9CILI|nr:unnamed protein product [Blepharisma stoltei]